MGFLWFCRATLLHNTSNAENEFDIIIHYIFDAMKAIIIAFIGAGHLEKNGCPSAVRHPR
jgi:hypothetical protein